MSTQEKIDVVDLWLEISVFAVRMKKAGGENRTRVISLEGWGFTTKLHPRYLCNEDVEIYENNDGMSTENI